MFPNRLTYEHIALLRQLFISVSMAMSQLSPLLFPVPLVSQSFDSARMQEQALTLALQDAEQLKPLLSQLAQLTTVAEVEARSLRHLELRPLLLAAAREVEEEDRTRSDREVKAELEHRQRLVVQGVKKRMRSTFDDLRLKSDPSTGKIWEAAVKSGRDRISRAAQENGENSVEDRGEEAVEATTMMAPEPFERAPSSPPPSPRARTPSLRKADMPPLREEPRTTSAVLVAPTTEPTRHAPTGSSIET